MYLCKRKTVYMSNHINMKRTAKLIYIYTNINLKFLIFVLSEQYNMKFVSSIFNKFNK